MSETKPKFLYLGDVNPANANSFEINESDLWNTGVDDHSDHPHDPHSSRRSKIPLKSHQQRKAPASTAVAKSMPVNVPDWSKILKNEYKRHESRYNEENDDDDDDNGNDNEKLPPHEYLARTRIASFSVHEGVGRTLKGRDLSRVRNAIWKQTGFEQD